MKQVAILVYEGCWAMSVYSARDFFKIVSLLEKHVGLKPCYSTKLVSLDGQPIVSACGSQIIPDSAISSTAKYDLIIIPAMEGPRLKTLSNTNAEIPAWLRTQITKSIPVISFTTGAYFIAASGAAENVLLATHWAFVRHLKALFPKANFTTHNSYLQTDTVYSTGSLNGCFEALLAFVSQDSGERFAHLCAAHLLIAEARHLSPVLPGHRNHNDEPILRVQDWIETRFAEALTIEMLAEKFGFSERNLKRRFQNAANISPNQYLQKVRIYKAKSLLIATTLSIKEIAHEVGYENVSFFTRLFKANTGATPEQWRKDVNQLASA